MRGRSGIRLAFDVSVWEIWGALLYGGRLVVVPESVARSPEDFHALLAAEKVSVLSQTRRRSTRCRPPMRCQPEGLAVGLEAVVFGRGGLAQWSWWIAGHPGGRG